MNDRRRLMWIHLSALLDLFFPFFSWLGPLIFWQWGDEDNPALDRHGRAAFRFQLSWWLYRGLVVFFAGLLFLIYFVMDDSSIAKTSPTSNAQVEVTVTDDDVLNEAQDQAENGGRDAEEEEENLKAEPIFPDSPDQEPSAEDDEKSGSAPNIAVEPATPSSGPDRLRSFLMRAHLDQMLARNGLLAGVALVTLCCLILLIWATAMFFALVNGFKAHSSDELIYPLTLPFFKNKEGGRSPPSH